MASQDDMLAQANGINANLAQLNSTLKTRFALGAFRGSFTMTATATYTVNDVNTVANSIILLQAFNAAAATLMGSAKALYISARTGGASFQVATANATAAAGTELFGYVIVNTG